MALARATGRDRDRRRLIHGAVAADLGSHGLQIARMEAGLRRADAGDLATDEAGAAAFARWR